MCVAKGVFCSRRLKGRMTNEFYPLADGTTHMSSWRRVPSLSSGRATEWIDLDGQRRRRYHDTGRWTESLPSSLDERGVERCRGNRCVGALVREAFDATTPERRPRAAPPHLTRALGHLARARDLAHLADLCRVQPSTAWSYLGQIVERWPKARSLVRPLVDEHVWDAVVAAASPEALEGSLVEVAARLGLRDTIEWRLLPDAYAHLRVARLCARGRIRARKTSPPRSSP